MKIIDYISEFTDQFSDSNFNEKNKIILLDFLKSYEFQRSLSVSQMSAFVNSIKTPSKKMTHKQKMKLVSQEEKNKLENKKKRSKKYMLLTKYKSDIISFRNEKLSYEKIGKSLIIKYNIPKKLQPSRQNIFNFCKDNNL